MNTAVGGWEIFSSAQVLEILSRVAQENNAHEILDDDWDKGVQY